MRPTLRRLTDLTFRFGSETNMLLVDARNALASLGTEIDDPLRKRAFLSACLHIESISQNKQGGGRRLSARSLLRAPFLHNAAGRASEHDNQQDTVRGIEALKLANTLADRPVSAQTFAALHRCLLADTTRQTFMGALRSSTKQLGGGRFQRFDAPIQPPDPSEIPGLLEDLAAFCNDSNISPVTKAALAYVQFMAIHPFKRANGKVARAVAQLVLARGGAASDAIAPLTLHQITHPHDYKDSISSVTLALQDEPFDGFAVEEWVRLFAQGCIEAASTATDLERRAEELRAMWQAELKVRGDSAVDVLMKSLVGIPVHTSAYASVYIDRSLNRTIDACMKLLEAGVLRQISEGRRNRVFEATAIVDLYQGIDGFQ